EDRRHLGRVALVTLKRLLLVARYVRAETGSTEGLLLPGGCAVASMPGYHINKGPFAFLDDTFDGTNPGTYTAALAAIAGGLLGAATTRLGPGTQLTCFQNQWLGNPGWNQFKPEATLQQGLTAAINAALAPDPAHPKPMEFFWICAREHTF